jgi:hypothetical protein
LWVFAREVRNDARQGTGGPRRSDGAEPQSSDAARLTA